ncbi:uncharacterized protein LOC120280299 isoform X5 [Dioscorea cayenensis subsp. rotundata]|uniref:Uncharacterized protein LOC120280299 isoform X5 n=1 Tax=Dioscorea cayennensis subsp. rotundata TaxID=55577 RepID=A0AB40CT63_DIOCR|nr:uncharacterized protein LOC120280299 isoform X5 [Dioscorea cayenensis subsp. rotundata]
MNGQSVDVMGAFTKLEQQCEQQKWNSSLTKKNQQILKTINGVVQPAHKKSSSDQKVHSSRKIKNWKNNRKVEKKIPHPRMRRRSSSSPALAAAEKKNLTVGILSFEVASAMSRAVLLYRSLSDAEISRLRSDTLASHAIRSLVSSDEHYLLSLSLAEKLDSLNRIAAVAARLGRRCSHPSLSGFEHVYSDLLCARLDPARLGFLTKDIDGAVRKMERLVASTTALYAELEALNDLEQSAKKLALPTDESRRALDQKIQWQRHDVRHLRDSSLWNQTFDKVVLLLARSVCTIHAKLRVVFGLDSIEFSESRQLCHRPGVSGPIRSENRDFQSENLRLHCGTSPRRLLLECLSLSSSAPLKDEFTEEHFESESYYFTGSLVPYSGVPFSGEQKCGKNGKSWFGPKSSLTMLAPGSSVGGSALGLHYANVIIIIEKLLRYPHLVGEEARDDLYQMLPSSLRMALKKSLKSYVKNLAIYDAHMAHDWKEAMEKILSWLAPMAHNMIRWQTERNFEQQQIVLRSNVLLIETLYFADRMKMEAAICELLIGLNYICRYEQQQNALLDCTSSLDFDDCMDWKMQILNLPSIVLI